MDSTALKAAVNSGNPLTDASKAKLVASVDLHDNLLRLNAQASALNVNWITLVLQILTGLGGFIPGLAPFVAIIKAILDAIGNLPLPNGGGGDIPHPVFGGTPEP